MRKKLTKRFSFNISLIPVILALFVLFSSIFFLSYQYLSGATRNKDSYSEIKQLEGNTMNFNELKVYFKALAQKKGAEYAYVVLNRASLPFGTDLHLLGHVVGDELFLQKGAQGMKYCTQDFRNACSHSIVVNLFYEKGEAALSEITASCQQAPGDGGYMMCYHGLGHGVFAYADYNLEKTVQLCQKVGTPQHNNREAVECIGGAIMEQISGGDHDKITWEKQRQINLLPNYPLYPCLGSVISDDESRNICLIYLTPYLWEKAGKIGPDLSDDIIKRSFSYCDELPVNETQYRDACFGGFGKEFVVKAKGNDIRNIQKLSDSEMKQVYDWCFLTPAKDGQKSCILYAQGSIYWSGANDKKIPEHFCSLAPNQESKDYCYQSLIGSVKNAEKSLEYSQEFCLELPEMYRDQCQKRLIK